MISSRSLLRTSVNIALPDEIEVATASARIDVTDHSMPARRGCTLRDSLMPEGKISIESNANKISPC